MAWRAARPLTWAGDGKTYAFGDVVPVDVNDPRVWWLMRAGLFVVPESPADLPSGASPYSFDPAIQAANRRIDRFLASKGQEAAPEAAQTAEDGETAPEAPKKAPAKKAASKAPAKKAAR